MVEDGLSSRGMVKRAVLRLGDSPQECLVDEALSDALSFIDDGLSSNGNTGVVLVHCEKGISRSPAVVCAYLMMSESIRFQDAINIIQQSRPIVRPNIGFSMQLRSLDGQRATLRHKMEKSDAGDGSVGTL